MIFCSNIAQNNINPLEKPFQRLMKRWDSCGIATAISIMVW